MIKSSGKLGEVTGKADAAFDDAKNAFTDVKKACTDCHTISASTRRILSGRSRRPGGLPARRRGPPGEARHGRLEAAPLDEMLCLDLTCSSVAENLALDEALLIEADAGRGGRVLRFWEPADYAVVLGASCRIGG